MFRDPLYRQIRRALRELKDGDAFEACANALLIEIYPSLAPREGGSDAGLDGLVANEHGASVQLICTTGTDVLGNLSGSIESNVKANGKPYACILTTSQRLTNPKKRELEDCARKMGRPLIQIYDQAAMAMLLYRKPAWRKELLGLTGDPTAISLFPITTRPLFDLPPLGREVELAKIQNAKGDTVVVGQPGSGKTHLLFTAAKKTKGRFVLDDNPGLIADAVRSIQPQLLIIDDAHSRLDLIKRLRSIRQEIHADFRIVASCWPGQEDSVSRALQVPVEKGITLEPLPQSQIKAVIESQKIFGPDHLVAEIIHQARGKPGLAVTLCRLCWESGSSRDVMLGTALARDVTLTLEPWLGESAIQLLGCFSLGGNAGMSLESVARLVDRNPLEIKRTVERLAAAGILEVSADRISVHPVRLRQTFVRDVFLKPPLVDVTPYLSEAPDYGAATRVLIEAKLMGGVLADEMLRARLQHLASEYEQTAFQEYVHLGKQEAEWVLDNFPEKLKSDASGALEQTPEKTLAFLLDAAAENYEDRSSQGWQVRTEDIMPQIKRWILGVRGSEVYERRKQLIDALEKWYLTTRNVVIAIQAAKLILSLRHESTSVPPGQPMSVTLHFGVVPQDQISKVASLWPRVLPILARAVPNQGGEISNLFHDWVHPNRPGNGMPAEYENESRSYARTMMAELLEAYDNQWTFHYRLHHYAEVLGLRDKIRMDPIVAVLHPPRDYDDWENHERQCSAAADELAAQLNAQEPLSVAKLLTGIEIQAREADIIECPSWARHICWRIAETTDDPTFWISVLRVADAPAHLLEPFFEKASSHTEIGEEINHLLDSEKYGAQALGVDQVLKHGFSGSAVWERARPLFKNYTRIIEGCVLRKEISPKNLKALLNHEDPEVREVVAARLCGVRESIDIPDELFEDWKRALIRDVDEEYEYILQSVFAKYPDIAFEWILWRLNDARSFHFGLRYDRALSTATDVITIEQRRALINQLTPSSATAELVRCLIGRNIEFFKELLLHPDLHGARLYPLQISYDHSPHPQPIIREFEESWQRMAIAAIEHGFSEDDIVSATQGGGFSWSGPLSGMYAARAEPFEKLLTHSDIRLRTIGKIGFEHFTRIKEQHLAAEKRDAIRGELN